MVSFWRTTSVCHFAPLFYLALYPLAFTKIHSEHKPLQSKFTLDTHAHTHTHTWGLFTLASLAENKHSFYTSSMT
jgi:hypothetical protein